MQADARGLAIVLRAGTGAPTNTELRYSLAIDGAPETLPHPLESMLHVIPGEQLAVPESAVNLTVLAVAVAPGYQPSRVATAILDLSTVRKLAPKPALLPPPGAYEGPLLVRLHPGVLNSTLRVEWAIISPPSSNTSLVPANGALELLPVPSPYVILLAVSAPGLASANYTVEYWVVPVLPMVRLLPSHPWALPTAALAFQWAQFDATYGRLRVRCIVNGSLEHVWPDDPSVTFGELVRHMPGGNDSSATGTLFLSASLEVVAIGLVGRPAPLVAHAVREQTPAPVIAPSGGEFPVAVDVSVSLVHPDAQLLVAQGYNRSQHEAFVAYSSPLLLTSRSPPAVGAMALAQRMAPSEVTWSENFLLSARVPPPGVTRAFMDGSGRRLTVEFDAPTNRAGATDGLQPCSHALSNSGALGSQPQCRWQAADRLIIVLSSDASLTPGTDLAFKKGEIRARPAWQAAPASPAERLRAAAAAVGKLIFDSLASTAVAVDWSAVQLRPHAVLIGLPAHIGPCTPLTLDASRSTGGGGRRLRFAWQVHAEGDKDVAALQAFLAAQPDSASVIALSASQVPAGTTVFSVTVTNYFAAQDSAAGSVVRDETALPVVGIEGPTQRTVRTGEQVRLRAIGSPVICVGGEAAPVVGDAAGLRFEWTQTAGPSVQPQTTPDPRVLALPPYSLRSPHTYAFLVTVTELASGRSNQAGVQLAVAPSALVVAVSGGNRVVGHSSFVLDASRSFDPDARAAAGGGEHAGREGLAFTWACRTRVPYLPCFLPDAQQPDTSAPRLRVPHGSLAVDRTYDFTVTVTVPGKPAAAATVFITLLNGMPPSVTLDAVPSKVSQSALLRLRGTVAPMTLGYTYTWVDGAGDPIAPVLASPLNRAALAVRTDLLVPGGTYTFELRAHNPSVSSLGGSASVTFSVNAPPYSVDTCALCVLPAAGIALVTKFSAHARGWSDEPDDLPVRFRFTYLLGDPGDASLQDEALGSRVGEQPLSAGFVDANSVESVLPQGQGVAGRVTLVVYVRDRLGATARQDAPSSSHLSVPPTELVDFLRARWPVLVAAAVASQNYDAAAANINALSRALNSREATVTTAAEADAAKQLREELLNALVVVRGSAARVASSLDSQLAALRSVTAVPQELSDGARRQSLRLMADAVQESLAFQRNILSDDTEAGADDVGLTDEAQHAVMHTLSHLLGLGMARGAPSTRRGLLSLEERNSTGMMMDTLQRLSCLQLDRRIAGEGVTMASPNIVLKARRSLLRDAAGETLVAHGEGTSTAVEFLLPVTALQAALVMRPEQMESETLDMHTVWWARNPFAWSDPEVDADVVSLTFLNATGESRCEELKVHNLTEPLLFTLPTTTQAVWAGVSYGAVPEPSSLAANATCMAGRPGNVTVACEGWSGEVAVPCNGSTHTVAVQCPWLRVRPSCVFWSEGMQAWDTDGCSVVNFTRGQTTCACTHLTDFTTRMRAVGERSHRVVGTADTLLSPRLADVARENYGVVLTVLAVYVVAMVACVAGRHNDMVQADNARVALVERGSDTMAASWLSGSGGRVAREEGDVAAAPPTNVDPARAVTLPQPGALRRWPRSRIRLRRQDTMRELLGGGAVLPRERLGCSGSAQRWAEVSHVLAALSGSGSGNDAGRVEASQASAGAEPRPTPDAIADARPGTAGSVVSVAHVPLRASGGRANVEAGETSCAPVGRKCNIPCDGTTVGGAQCTPFRGTQGIWRTAVQRAQCVPKQGVPAMQRAVAMALAATAVDKPSDPAGDASTLERQWSAADAYHQRAVISDGDSSTEEMDDHPTAAHHPPKDGGTTRAATSTRERFSSAVGSVPGIRARLAQQVGHLGKQTAEAVRMARRSSLQSGKMARAWLAAMRQHHEYLALCFTWDKYYGRAERMAVLLCLLMANMFADALLFGTYCGGHRHALD